MRPPLLTDAGMSEDLGQLGERLDRLAELVDAAVARRDLRAHRAASIGYCAAIDQLGARVAEGALREAKRGLVDLEAFLREQAAGS